MDEYIKYNKETKEAMEKRHREPIGKIHPLHIANAFVCIECGEFVNSLNVSFYKYDIEKVKCYTCQDKERNDEKNKIA